MEDRIANMEADRNGVDAGHLARRGERLQKVLSSRGIASRREAEHMIQDGRVKVNGKTAEIGQCAQADSDIITVDGKPIGPASEYVYIMLNKPRGYITTSSDDRGRKTVMSLVAGIDRRVYPVGRLDMDSEGLLLLTDDGSFAQAVAHPSGNKVKTYEAHVRGDAAGAVSAMSEPMIIDSRAIRAVTVEVIRQDSISATLRISIREGRNRQVRKMCRICGLTVLSLSRVSIGGLELGALKTGQWRYLTDEEVRLLRDQTRKPRL